MKDGQYLGLWLKTERHLVCEVRFAGFMHTSLTGLHLFVQSLCGIHFPFKERHTKTQNL